MARCSPNPAAVVVAGFRLRLLQLLDVRSVDRTQDCSKLYNSSIRVEADQQLWWLQLVA